jgi:hypothetical protein
MPGIIATARRALKTAIAEFPSALTALSGGWRPSSINGSESPTIRVFHSEEPASA